jgi:hypothetical protein
MKTRGLVLIYLMVCIASSSQAAFLIRVRIAHYKYPRYFFVSSLESLLSAIDSSARGDDFQLYSALGLPVYQPNKQDRTACQIDEAVDPNRAFSFEHQTIGCLWGKDTTYIDLVNAHVELCRDTQEVLCQFPQPLPPEGNVRASGIILGTPKVISFNEQEKLQVRRLEAALQRALNGSLR